MSENSPDYDVTYYKSTQYVDSGGVERPGVFIVIGKAFKNAKGRIKVKLDSLPIQPWCGDLTLFPKHEPDEKAEAPKRTRKKAQA